MSALDLNRARAFIAAVPKGRWAAYEDVATAAGSPRGAQAVGSIPHVYRVLRADGFVPEGFRPAGPGVPANAAAVRNVLRAEGVSVDRDGRASPKQRFSADDWSGSSTR